MPHFIQTLGFLANQNHFLGYLIVYIGTIFLGNAAAFAGFWFVAQNYFGAHGLLFLMITLFVADVSGDMLWYSLGKAFRDTRIGSWIKNHLPRHREVEAHLQQNNGRWILLSKFFYGSCFPIIFSIGWSRVQFKRFLRISFLSIFVWLAVFFVISSVLIASLHLLQAIHILKRLEWLFVIGIILFIALQYILAKGIERFFTKKEG